jgi:hypothetical protein
MNLNGGTGLNLLMEFQDLRFFAVAVVVTCLLHQFLLFKNLKIQDINNIYFWKFVDKKWL